MRGAEQDIAGHHFTGFGAHHSSYLCTYLTAAAALGVARSDVDSFIRRLDKVFIKKTSTTSNYAAVAAAVEGLTVNDSEGSDPVANVNVSTDHKRSDEDVSSVIDLAAGRDLSSESV